MKYYITADIKGRGFFKKYLLFYIPLLVLSIISNRFTDELPLLSSLASIIESYISILLTLAMVIYAVQFVFIPGETLHIQRKYRRGCAEDAKVVSINSNNPRYLQPLDDQEYC